MRISRSLLLYCLATLGGAWLGVSLFGPRPDPLLEASPSLVASVPSWCLGRRSKAQRLAYWREKTGLEPNIPARDPSKPVTVSYNRDIAPILFQHCSGCHRPGEIAPFSVLSYQDVRPWAWLIGVVTATRYMPPWPPEPAEHLRFEGERLLSRSEIALIQNWIEDGAPEGEPGDLPPLPKLPGEWQLGEPDLVVAMDSPYTLAHSITGDVYRNFVIPVSVESARWVRAVEIKPDSKQVVHHAIMQVDGLGEGRRLDAEDAEPGFAGMDLGSAENPGGHFIGWSPGKAPTIAPESMPWRIDPGTDLILQIHMLANGIDQVINPKIGLYFTDQPATKRQPFGLFLRGTDIDIDPGNDDYRVKAELELPVDVTVLGIFPHAHYLGRDIRATAKLPDGQELTLIWIKDWDFGWQDEYRYREPVFLPAGTVLRTQFIYDNSTANPRNPSNPPIRVVGGNRSTDEMAILMLQVLPEKPDDEAIIREAVARGRLENNPDSWFSRNLLGVALRMQGRTRDAVEEFLQARTLNPDNDDILYNLGNAYLALDDLEQALATYRQLLELAPRHPKAHNNYAIALQRAGDISNAINQFELQLALTPDNPQTRFNLSLALGANGEAERAYDELLKVQTLDPAFTPVYLELGDYQRIRGNQKLAIEWYHRALNDPAFAGESHLGIGLARLADQARDEAREHLITAIRTAPQTLGTVNDIAWSLATNPSPSKRSPGNAVFLAELINTESDHSIPELLDTLAAAYASQARYADAIETMHEAIRRLGEDQSHAEEFRQRLQLYERNEAYVSTSSAAGHGS